MTPREERQIGRLWQRWSVGKMPSNQAFTDFFFEIIQPSPSLGHCNAFEVLDVLTNLPDAPDLKAAG